MFFFSRRCFYVFPAKKNKNERTEKTTSVKPKSFGPLETSDQSDFSLKAEFESTGQNTLGSRWLTSGFGRPSELRLSEWSFSQTRTEPLTRRCCCCCCVFFFFPICGRAEHEKSERTKKHSQLPLRFRLILWDETVLEGQSCWFYYLIRGWSLPPLPPSSHDFQNSASFSCDLFSCGSK